MRLRCSACSPCYSQAASAGGYAETGSLPNIPATWGPSQTLACQRRRSLCTAAVPPTLFSMRRLATSQSASAHHGFSIFGFRIWNFHLLHSSVVFRLNCDLPVVSEGMGMRETCQILGVWRWFSLGTQVSSATLNWLVTT